MAKLQVTPDYLEQLAAEQDEAATRLDEAIAAVAGRAAKLWYDHGFISFNSVLAMQTAEQQRESASNNMIGVCNDMSANLRAGADAYTETDKQAGANLDRQMLYE